MSKKLPRVSGREAIKALQKLGFIVKRVTGSHHILYHPTKHRIVTIPFHRELKPGVLLDIIKTAGISRDEFREFL